jgi:hypothetical protein
MHSLCRELRLYFGGGTQIPIYFALESLYFVVVEELGYNYHVETFLGLVITRFL